MKKLLVCLFALFTLSVQGKDDKYVATMEKMTTRLDTATSISTIQNLNNGFERIVVANPAEWLPLYYQSYCNVLLGMKTEGNSKKDEYYDNAESIINKADSISPDNSEIYVMKAWIMSMRISVDPATRGQKYGMQSSELRSKAVELDKENPRAYLMKGQGLFYTPEQYGGGAEKACPVLEKAVKKFEKFVPSSSIMPHWGETQAQEALARCNKKLQDGK